MTMFMDTTTGEIYSGSISSVDGLIETITATERKINELRLIASEAKSKLCAMAKFNGGVKTARIQGEKYKCKVELPSKIAWNQKELEDIFYKEQELIAQHSLYDSTFKPAISIGSYKVDLREYKKILHTVYSNDSEKETYKLKLMKANLGYIGAPRVTIEEVKNG